MSSLGSRIKEYRKKRGYTQAQMAERLGMTEANFSSYERDKSKPPSEKLSQIASILNVSTDYLLGFTDDPTPGMRAGAINLETGDVYFLNETETRINTEIESKLDEISKLKDHLNKLDEDEAIEEDQKSAIKRSLLSTIDKLNHEINELKNELKIPSWASRKDIRDFKKMLESDMPVMFDGVPIEGEARQRVIDILTGLFWEAKQMNKKTYGRKKKGEGSKDSKE